MISRSNAWCLDSLHHFVLHTVDVSLQGLLLSLFSSLAAGCSAYVVEVEYLNGVATLSSFLASLVSHPSLTRQTAFPAVDTMC